MHSSSALSSSHRALATERADLTENKNHRKLSTNFKRDNQVFTTRPPAPGDVELINPVTAHSPLIDSYSDSIITDTTNHTSFSKPSENLLSFSSLDSVADLGAPSSSPAANKTLLFFIFLLFIFIYTGNDWKKEDTSGLSNAASSAKKSFASIFSSAPSHENETKLFASTSSAPTSLKSTITSAISSVMTNTKIQRRSTASSSSHDRLDSSSIPNLFSRASGLDLLER